MNFGSIFLASVMISITSSAVKSTRRSGLLLSALKIEAYLVATVVMNELASSYYV